jgi:hypothetical protein
MYHAEQLAITLDLEAQGAPDRPALAILDFPRHSWAFPSKFKQAVALGHKKEYPL